MPSEAEEIWRYSGIDAFDLDGFAPDPDLGDAEVAVAAGRAAAAAFGDHAALVVTVDGHVASIELPGSAAAVDGLLVTSAGSLDIPPAALGAVTSPGDAFDELNDACLRDAVLVEVAADRHVDAPVLVVHTVTTAPVGELGRASFPRVAVRLSDGSSAGLVELFVSLPPGEHGGAPDGGRGPLVVPVTELQVADGARLAYASIQELDRSATQIAVQASRVGTGGELLSFSAVAGGGYSRLRSDATVAGAGGSSTLLAAFLATGDQVFDFRTHQEHAAPRSRSELLFKGAVADSARSVYSGLISVRRGARGTDAVQTNHNLVLSEGARADSVPNLDIEENDVRCSHASTVGPIDEEQRYYLESRGIEPSVADRLVVAGFFADLAARAPFPGVGRRVDALVGERLAARLPALAERGDG